MKTLIEKFPAGWFLKNAASFPKHFFRFHSRAQLFLFFTQKMFLSTNSQILTGLVRNFSSKKRYSIPRKKSHLYPRRSRRTRVRVGKHGAYQVETSVSTQLTPPNLIVAASTSARCRSTTLSKSARCSVRECFAVIYKFEGRRLTLSDVDRQACHLNVLLTILFPSPSSNRSNWVSSADPTFFATFLHFFFE